ncbi:MAG: glutamate synthase large subunit [Candidatus Margulisbacteria bacterium]|jgi:glutamate synthase domain-containing protein 2/glutamate synthase domain-containing protein 1/glutamate synthase domain-containing protein 3|nr:glutamate synthase large subunit [Candidatus Margulisiibacteriota bacterium]
MKAQGLYSPEYEHDSCGVGFVVDVKGRVNHQIVEQGLEILKRLAHRGAVGADPQTGDGAGIMIQIPHEYYLTQLDLPKPGAYGTGLVFLPREKKEREKCKSLIAGAVAQAGQNLIGWRTVRVDHAAIGRSARESEPVIEQLFVRKGSKVNTPAEFELRLYELRRTIERTIKAEGFYLTNLSSRTVIYKGLLMADQVEKFYPELREPKVTSALALVHSRYSTNTFPAWNLAQPFRLLAHNGEINTLRGNVNWLKARGLDVVLPGGSDSAALDNILELLILSGRSLPHALMMLVPQAWEHDQAISPKLQEFYRFHAGFMEPWDGPAALAVTDGIRVGAVLDRNGLRPARYIVTDQDLVIMASEAGVLDIPPASIVKSGRLEPGKILFIDTEQGKIIDNETIKHDLAAQQPYGDWLSRQQLDLAALPPAEGAANRQADLTSALQAFGYTREDLRTIIKPMAEQGKEPIGSMGNDTPLAVLSNKPQLLYSYFRQLFAQVTNPPIDPIREEIVMSLESYLGEQQNILQETPEHCRLLRLAEPILTNEQLATIRRIDKPGFKVKTISLLYGVKGQGARGVEAELERVCREAEEAINAGFTFLLLTDRGVDSEHAALPALLAVGGVHHHLISQALRTKASIILESGEPREVHHFALLFGYGADAVDPYLAYEAIEQLVAQGELTIDAPHALRHFRVAVHHGLEKVLSKMGISTLRSYRGAQIFEAVGIGAAVIDRCFTGTVSRLGGIGFDVLTEEVRRRHLQAYNDGRLLPSGGLYQWRRDGEFHLWNPDSIAAFQDAVRHGDYARFREFSRLIDDQSAQPTTLRSLLKFKPGKPVPLEQVEPVAGIVKRFATGAMSFGSISRGAHEALAVAMNLLGGRSNTGEGGEEPERFRDNRRSAIKQVASGRFGVNTNYLINADELQIKIAQGAKPGEGGQLPGHKVSAIIAQTRFTTPGVTLISPPPHHDIYSIEDLAQLIFDLKNVNPRARISVKLVSEAGVGTVAAGVAKGHADMILISGGDGGTGASPISSIRHAGLPWELGLAETHQTLVLNDLRSRVRLQTDGQLRTGRDVAIAAMLGAEEYGFATGALIALGCVMLRHCHLNNCSVGVATQDEACARRFAGKPEYVVNFLRFVAEELREIMAALGVRTVDELIGRTDLLEVNSAILPWKAKELDYSRILWRAAPQRCEVKQDHGIDRVLDRRLIEVCRPALEKGSGVKSKFAIKNSDRTTGAMLAGEVCRRYGEHGLPADTIWLKFGGVAGQSFGAWLARGMTFELFGLANDYVGKGLSGGKIIVHGWRENDVAIGNTTFYGAIAGEAYIRGRAGERFCIRNSGLNAVVEGVGDHGCEYMTGGRVVVLGPTGRNFAAGMSGGIAYVYDQAGDFAGRCNQGMVALEGLEPEDERTIIKLLNEHAALTGSRIARDILDDFGREKRRFVKVMPVEYRRLLLESAMDEEELDLLGVSDG